ncbi:hypothetical protein BKA62DRAFT_724389 [Auriculariales sp. MPI-PUGE-AT-0066]|nr:hypothetical protein BKA62DRAFT_724389 [Auriculariales sp. MPI-PUGE-AT-0066]
MRFSFAVALFSCLAMILAAAVDKKADLPASTGKQPKPPAQKEPKPPTQKQPKPPARKEPKPPARKQPKPPTQKQPGTGITKPLKCYPSVARGTLAIFKSSIEGQRVPLTLNGTTLVLQGTGGSKKPQAQFKIVPCTSEFLKQNGQNPGNGGIHVNGHVVTADGKCLARNSKNAAVNAVESAQFWSVAIIQHGNGNEAHNQPIDMTVDKFFHHLYGGIVHESVTKPPSNWILTFSTK